jgi:lipopolysaccharide transport system ATP-binding protein
LLGFRKHAKALPMSSEIAIKVESLSKCYQIYDKPHDRLLQMVARRRKSYFHEFWALKEVSFEISKGEAVGIIGKNGSGKSTLLQLICGTLNPTGGLISTVGRVAALLELGSGFNPEFTGIENVYMNGALLGLTKNEIDERLDDIAAFADIGEFIKQPVKTYSSGMAVRLAFAVGDAVFTQKCMRFIRKYREENTLLLVSHDTAAITNICNRALWLDHGVLKASGDAKTTCETYLNNIFAASTQDSALPLSRSTDSANSIKRLHQSEEPTWRDQRADFLNSSPLRNDIEVFKFSDNEQGLSFGGQDAKIINALLLDVEGNALTWVVGGEKITLRIEAEIHQDLQSPILGFFVKDRLGQTLFGDNTYISYEDNPCTAKKGGEIVAEFDFFMPWLAQGDYIIQVAIAEGTQTHHRQLHWIHDALVFRSHHSPVSTGIIGIPMIDIRLKNI